MSVGANIRRIRKSKGMTLEQVALAAKTDTGNLSRLERGGQGYTDAGLKLIAKALGVPVSQFFAEDDEHVAEPPTPYAVRQRTKPETLRVLHFEAPASMGGGLPVPERDTILDRIDLNSAWVRTNLPDVSNPANLTFITGYGDSMEKTFFDGDILFVDRGTRELKIDAVYVFTLDAELYIKRLQRMPDGAVKIISDNKKYESFNVTNGKRGSMQILGRVVGAWNWHRL